MDACSRVPEVDGAAGADRKTDLIGDPGDQTDLKGDQMMHSFLVTVIGHVEVSRSCIKDLYGMFSSRQSHPCLIGRKDRMNAKKRQ